MKEKNKIFISVIIPTYHDWERLQLCLDALYKQTYAKESFEVIIVNNDPNDHLPASLELPKNYQLVVEREPGSYAARNKGASLASGVVFSFTDADCIPEANWLEMIAAHYSYNEGILSGSVKMFSVLNNPRLNFSESYDYVFGINQDIYAQSNAAATANLSITAKEFFMNNSFRSDLLSGGDIDFCQRASYKGISFYYSESLIVKHPLRNNMESLIIKAKRLAGGKVYANRLKGVLLAISPPLVRLHILFFKKKAPLVVKVKCFFVIIKIKFHQALEACRVFLGGDNERA